MAQLHVAPSGGAGSPARRGIPGARGGVELRARRLSRRAPPFSRAAPGCGIGVGALGGGGGPSSGQTASRISSRTASGVRSTPSVTRIRPESAACTASRAVSRAAASSRVCPRRPSRPSSSSTRSIAPRTDEPVRRSRCSRVARVSRTARSIGRSPAPVTPATIARSAVGVLVAEHDAAHPVGDRLAHPGGADRVEGVHRGDQPESRGGTHRAQPRHRDLALGQHGDEDVERLLRDPVELLQVQQPRAAHRRQQRSVDEVGRHVAAGEHGGGVVLADQPGRGQLGVALHEDDVLPHVGRDRAQQRGLAGARRPLEDDVPVRAQGDREDLALPAQPDDRRRAGGQRPPSILRLRWSMPGPPYG